MRNIVFACIVNFKLHADFAIYTIALLGFAGMLIALAMIVAYRKSLLFKGEVYGCK